MKGILSLPYLLTSADSLVRKDLELLKMENLKPPD